MHWRVLPSPCFMPMPNLARAPRNAISSVTIWPVLMKATESLPWRAWTDLNFFWNSSIAVSHETSSSSPDLYFLRRGVVARSVAFKGSRASHPLGHAMPRLTG